MDPTYCEEMMTFWIRLRLEEERLRAGWKRARKLAGRRYVAERIATALDRLFGAYVVGLREPKGAGRVSL